MDKAKSNRGIGLLELLLVLAIIGVILLLATRYYREASENLRVTTTVKNIHTLVGSSFKWLQGHYNFADKPPVTGSISHPLSISELINTGLLSTIWKNKKDPWGGEIAVAACPNDNSKLKVMFTGPNVNACNDINDMLSKQGMVLVNKSCSPIAECVKGGGYIGMYTSE